MTDYVTKDSGERAQFESGMQRDTEKGKPRFDLMLAEGVPYEEQMITRFAALLGRGAEKYDDRNWEKADSEAEMARMKSSAFRHFMQWMSGETDEDHAAGTMFNILAFETTKYKVEKDLDGSIAMAPLGDGKIPNDWQDVGYVSDDDASVRMYVGGGYGPPPTTPSAFVDSLTSVSKASEMVKQYRDAGYTAKEAEQLRRMHPAFAPDQEQVKEQIQVHFNGGFHGGITSHAEGSVARLLEDQIAATRRGW